MAMNSKKAQQQYSLFQRQSYFDDMPEFSQEDLLPYHSVQLHFRDRFDMEAFERLMGQRVKGYKHSSMWYPEMPRMRRSELRYVGPPRTYDENSTPIYVVSKGRWQHQKSMTYLHEMGRPHYVIVEPQEADLYRQHLPPSSTVLELDMSYKERYEVCDEHGLTRSTGSGPARNFAWDHAAKLGSKWHWTIDDNISGWYRLNRNLKTPCVDPFLFDIMESYADRFENIAMAGPNYHFFCNARNSNAPPVRWNTRVYSCNLIRTDLPFRWRARYNEDVDLSLQMLKAGFCTALFNMFLQNKPTTQTTKGGNTSELYGIGTADKSAMIARLHPDVASVVERFSRIHHHVDYARFKKNQPVLIPGYEPIPDDMWLEVNHEGEWHRIGKRSKARHYALSQIDVQELLKKE